MRLHAGGGGGKGFLDARPTGRRRFEGETTHVAPAGCQPVTATASPQSAWWLASNGWVALQTLQQSTSFTSNPNLNSAVLSFKPEGQKSLGLVLELLLASGLCRTSTTLQPSSMGALQDPSAVRRAGAQMRAFLETATWRGTHVTNVAMNTCRLGREITCCPHRRMPIQGIESEYG